MPGSAVDSTPSGEDEAAPRSEREAPARASRRGAAMSRVLGVLRSNGYLVLVAGALIVITRTIQFTPPERVRVGTADVGQIIGDAPQQEFASTLAHPQSVQIRATLRLYPDNELKVSQPDPQVDAQGKLLSQPIVTTILGMNATVEQTVRLEDGALEVDVLVNATPRLGPTPRGRSREPGVNTTSKAPGLVVETEIHVESRRRPWWRGRVVRRVQLESRAFLEQLEEHGHRVVFTVDQHLFSLDLELRSAAGA